MLFSQDMIDFIHAHFIEQERHLVIAMLQSALLHDKTFPDNRLLRCALWASQSDLIRLQYYIDNLAIDYRDVIVAGEYDIIAGKLIKQRNFSEPFIN